MGNKNFFVIFVVYPTIRESLMKIFTFFSICIFILLSASLFSQQDAFRVMTYNIRYAGDEKADGENAWSKRKDPVSLMIRFHKADIVGLQEALRNQIDDLTKILPQFGWTGAGRDDGKDQGEFSAILFNKNKFEKLDNGTFWLSENPDVPSKGWDAALNRVCSWIKLKDKLTDKQFFFFNTHFDHIGETARTNSSRLILDKIKSMASGLPVILTGDFNYTSSAEGYKFITSENSPLKDAQFISQSGHYGSDVTFNNFGEEHTPGNKIDFIFVNDKISVFEHGVIGETFNGKYPSDHMPVVAEIKIK